MVERSAPRTSQAAQNANEERSTRAEILAVGFRERGARECHSSFTTKETILRVRVPADRRRNKKLLHSTLRVLTIRFRHIQGRAHLA